MELSFYPKLNETQRSYADRIAAKAREMGIPPELAVAVAYKESGLNPAVGAGAAGEIGIMQIKPATAKELGFTANQLRDPEQNISAGLQYLKKSLDLSEGDLRLAAAGYNAGINHPFFSSENKSLPDSTINYLRDLKSFGTFQTPIISQTTKVEVEERPSADAMREYEESVEKKSEQLGELSGAALGAGESARRIATPLVRRTAEVLSPTVRKATRILGGLGAAEPPATPLGGTMAPAVAEQATAANRILQGTADDLGTTGRARMQGFNVETAQQAARAREAAQNVGALQRQGVVAQGAPDVLARAPGMTSSPSGILYPRTAAAAPPAPPATPKGGLEEVTKLFRDMIEPGSKARAIGSTVIKYGAPPLAGYQMGSELGSMYGESKKQSPDYAKMALSGLGALGAGLSMFPATAPVGIPLAVGAPFAQYLRENKGPQAEQISETVAP